MDITQWYAICLGCFLGLPIIAPFIFSHSILRICQGVYVRKHMTYPQLPRYFGRPVRVTRLDLLVLIAFLVGNVLCLASPPSPLHDLAKRSGLISIINIMPVSFGANMNVLASLCDIRLPAYAKAHRWLGRVAIVEGMVHVAVCLANRKLDLHALPDAAAMTAGISFFVIFFSGPLRSRVYEVFSYFHPTLGAVALGAIYLHVNSRELLRSPAVYLAIAVCIQILIVVIRLGSLLYRNIPLNRVSIRAITFGGSQHISDAVHVHVRLSRPWRPQAGQYVYLCIPGVSSTAFAQLHPFYISWWYREENHDHIVVVVQGRKGFSRNLLLHTSNGLHNDFKMQAIMEGPYGKELALDSYGTVLLFATGIGIAGQLAYVERLLEGYRKCEVKARTISLYWEVEEMLQTAWVANRMQLLLDHQDLDRILDIHVFVRGGLMSLEKVSHTMHTPKSERLRITYDSLDGESVSLEKLIKAAIQHRKGLTMVSMCTNSVTGNKIRNVVRGLLDETIHVKELDFQPTSSEDVSFMRALFKRGKHHLGPA